MSILIKLVLLAATALVAGLVPTVLFFRTAADRRVFIIGGAATAATYLVVRLGLPGLVVLTFNGLAFYPVWAILLGFPAAIAWRLGAALGPDAPTEEERMDRIRQQAREKARRTNRR